MAKTITTRKKNVSSGPSKAIYNQNLMGIAIPDNAKKISLNHYSNGKEWNSYIPNTKVNRDAIVKKYGTGDRFNFRGKKGRMWFT